MLLSLWSGARFPFNVSGAFGIPVILQPQFLFSKSPEQFLIDLKFHSLCFNFPPYKIRNNQNINFLRK
jgi:hypothetical protein